jgi:hypothetical protein
MGGNASIAETRAALCPCSHELCNELVEELILI